VQEHKKLTDALAVNLAAMKKTAEAEVEELKASATRESDKLKAAAQKREHELTEALTQAMRKAGEAEGQLKLTEGRTKALESEIERKGTEKDAVLQELASLRNDYDWALQSRDALAAEMDELRSMLK
jgi:chromosome segregation ATPase